MTVRQLMDILSELPGDAEVTDVGGNPISKVNPEKSEGSPGEMVVWLDTDYIFDIDDIDID